MKWLCYEVVVLFCSEFVSLRVNLQRVISGCVRAYIVLAVLVVILVILVNMGLNGIDVIWTIMVIMVLYSNPCPSITVMFCQLGSKP